jgi:hypothetical protein
MSSRPAPARTWLRHHDDALPASGAHLTGTASPLSARSELAGRCRLGAPQATATAGGIRQAAAGDPQAGLEYLDATHRVAISNKRIFGIDAEQVVFRVRVGAGRGKNTTSSGVEFIDRFLLHVLPAASSASAITGYSRGRASARPGTARAATRRADAVIGHRRVGCRLPAPRRTHRASRLLVLRRRTDARGGTPSMRRSEPFTCEAPMIAAPCSPQIRLLGAPVCVRGGPRPIRAQQRSGHSIPTAVRKGLCRDIGWPAGCPKSARFMPKN